MPINRLQALQTVLSQTGDEIARRAGLPDEAIWYSVQKYIQENSDAWRANTPDINYQEPFCRMAYLYMNVAVHATLVERAIAAFEVIEGLIEERIRANNPLNVCALGGGPGSELLGLVRYIESLTAAFSGALPTALVDFALVDRVVEWDESWHALKRGVDQQLAERYGKSRAAWPVTISKSFLSLDLTKPEDFRSFPTRFGDIDLFILSYVVSELKGKFDPFLEVFDMLVERASPGAVFLIVDRNEKTVRDFSLQLIDANTRLTCAGTVHERGRLEDDLRDLGKWYINIESLPRRRWEAFVMAASKVAGITGQTSDTLP